MVFKDKLIEFNKRGLIQAPDESDENFFCRCRRAERSNASIASDLAQKTFDINPDWIWVTFNNKGLHFWEGGCTIIQQEHVILQLNKAFDKKSTYFGYTRDEVIAHELAHVVRGNFEEPIFEEILAFQTSPSSFRRYFGPLFRTSNESLVFMLSLAVLSLTIAFGILQIFSFLIFAGLMSIGLARLFRSQFIFSKTRKKLARIVGQEKALAVMIRLTDREIIRFSQMGDNQIRSYAKKMAKIKMRWQQISSAYSFN
jgi:hypothetical protein